jgi:hypothetical protein
LSRTDLRDGARALQSHALNKQMISEKIPSLFAFLARVPRMRHTVFVCRFMQMLRTKMKMKIFPGYLGATFIANRITPSKNQCWRK